MNTLLRKLCCSLALLISAPLATAQVATGTYPYGTFDNKGFDTINVGNLNVHFSIPVLNKAGRGIPFYYNLSFDSSVWYPVTVSGVQTWTPVQGFGWSGDTEVATGYVSYVQNVSTRGACTTVRNSQFVYHDTFGTSHSFNGAATEVIPSGSGTCSSESYPGSGLTAVANDNSGYTINVTGISTVSLTSASGKQISPPVQYGTGSATYTDSNGNRLSVNSTGSFTDTTGNVVLKVAGSAPSAHTFTYTDTNGDSQSVSMNYTTYMVQTNFGCSGIGEYGPTSTSLVSSITMPDGSTYQFTYEPAPNKSGSVTGRIASVTLPSGGAITYTHTGGSNGIVCGDGSTAGLSRSISTNGGSSASTWSYARTAGTTTSQTAVTDGLGNQSTYAFVLGSVPSGQTNGVTADYYETSRVINQGSSTTLVSRATCYNASAQPCTTTALTLPITQIDTYETLNGIQQHGSEAKFNTYGLQTDEYDYDFGGASSRGSLLRHEVWTYPTSGIANLVSKDQVYDGSGNIASQSSYSYDGSTPTASSGVPSHVAVSGQRGNLTAVTQYTSSSAFVSSSATYEDTGSVLTLATPNGTTQNSYDSSFVYDTGVTPPTPSSGVALPYAAGFDTSYTGLQTSSTDPNNAQTVYKYSDPLLRLTEVDSPDGGKSTYTYTPTQLGVHSYQNSNIYSDTETQVDSYARLSRVAVANGQASDPWYQSDICYDANANTSFKSYAYQGTGWPTAKVCSGSGDTYSYDALGRVTKVSHADGTSINYSYNGRASQIADENGVTRISQIDGLGRLTAVCEVSSSTLQGVAPSACNLDISGTGFSTTYAYTMSTRTTTVTQGAQTRVFQTDWAGRPTLVQEPESGQTTYSYAYNSTGLQVTRTRPAANQSNSTVLTTTTTQYDALGRAVSVGYNDGITGGINAYYDAPVPTSITQTNMKGRLANIVRLVPGTSTTQVGMAPSYDSLGRIVLMTQCMPSSCGNLSAEKHFTYTYDWLGNQLTSSDGNGVVTTKAYTVANEISSITSSANDGTHPPNLVSSIKNGPFGTISYLLGNGLSGFNTYDSLGRLNGKWVCTGSNPQPSCSASSMVNGFTMTWKGQQLKSSTDSVLPANGVYTYDDFNRLALTNYVGANYEFNEVYDRYGNRWQQNTVVGNGGEPQISYDPTTNRINTSGYVTDAAGNVTYDGFHHYSFDAEGNVLQIDSGQTETYTHDFFGHIARADFPSNVSAPLEFYWNPGGQLASTWNSSTSQNISGMYYWGGTEVGSYYDNETHFEHKDWVDTTRMTTSYNGGTESTFDSLPFGDGYTDHGTSFDYFHFGGMMLDSLALTHVSQFRQYSGTEGRWLAPDPYDGSYDFTNPQSFNRYSYVQNNPLSFVDPSGLCLVGRNGETELCGGGGGDDGTIDGIDEFEFLQIPIVEYESFYFPTQSWSGVTQSVQTSLGPGDMTPSILSFSGYFPVGSGADLLLDWVPQGGSGSNGDNCVPGIPCHQKVTHSNPVPVKGFQVCGAGVFAYGGRSFDAGPVNGFAGGIIEADSSSGISKGALFELGGGEAYMGGAGKIVSSSGNGLGSANLVYGGVGGGVFGAHGATGFVGFSSGAGVFGEISAAGREIGVGGYLDLATTGRCGKQ